MDFLDINLTRDSSLLLHAIHSPFFWWIVKKTIVFTGFKYPFVDSRTLQFRANHLLGQYRMDDLTELRHIYLEDFLLTSLFPDFCPQQVGGFIPIILRGLLRLNYDEYIHNAALHTFKKSPK
jgi:hypothetical protein